MPFPTTKNHGPEQGSARGVRHDFRPAPRVSADPRERCACARNVHALTRGLFLDVRAARQPGVHPCGRPLLGHHGYSGHPRPRPTRAPAAWPFASSWPSTFIPTLSPTRRMAFPCARAGVHRVLACADSHRLVQVVPVAHRRLRPRLTRGTGVLAAAADPVELRAGGVFRSDSHALHRQERRAPSRTVPARPRCGHRTPERRKPRAKGANFLFEELARRTEAGPIGFHVVVQTARDGDVVDDATVRGPRTGHSLRSAGSRSPRWRRTTRRRRKRSSSTQSLASTGSSPATIRCSSSGRPSICSAASAAPAP